LGGGTPFQESPAPSLDLAVGVFPQVCQPTPWSCGGGRGPPSTCNTAPAPRRLTQPERPRTPRATRHPRSTLPVPPWMSRVEVPMPSKRLAMPSSPCSKTSALLIAAFSAVFRHDIFAPRAMLPREGALAYWGSVVRMSRQASHSQLGLLAPLSSGGVCDGRVPCLWSVPCTSCFGRRPAKSNFTFLCEEIRASSIAKSDGAYY